MQGPRSLDTGPSPRRDGGGGGAGHESWDCRAGRGPRAEWRHRGLWGPSLPPPQVESNLGNYHRFLMQALTYLSSPDRNLKQAAMKFIGGCWPLVLCSAHRAHPAPTTQSPELPPGGPGSRVRGSGGPVSCRGQAGLPQGPGRRPCPPPSVPGAGGMLQDYFPDLCICLRKADVRTLRKREPWPSTGASLFPSS